MQDDNNDDDHDDTDYLVHRGRWARVMQQSMQFCAFQVRDATETINHFFQ